MSGPDGPEERTAFYDESFAEEMALELDEGDRSELDDKHEIFGPFDSATGEFLCDTCAEHRWQSDQERLIEDGPDDSARRREDQQLRDAGRGHLVRS